VKLVKLRKWVGIQICENGGIKMSVDGNIVCGGGITRGSAVPMMNVWW
jgi:hypothetical protein